MPDGEKLAQYVAANTDGYSDEDKRLGRNWAVPPLPKPGEYIVCQRCGKVMKPEDFSKDPKIRKYEFKWHIHWDCQQAIWNQLDRMTSGVLSERESNSYLDGYYKKVNQKISQDKRTNR